MMRKQANGVPDRHRVMGEGGEAFKGRVMNPNVFRVYMLVKMPVLGVTGTWLKVLDLERCVAVLPYSWRVRNLFGVVTTGALAAAAEIASVSLWVINIRNQGAALTPVPVTVTVEAQQPVTEAVTFRCLDGERYADVVLEAAGGASVEEACQVEGVNVHGQRVCLVTLWWRLDPKS
ncbi:MAG: hypothetical protein AAFS10_02845 [Myxococcota bacterium]